MIPKEMREAARWIIWKAVQNPKTGKLDKIPLDPRTKKRFRRDSGWQTNPQMWVTYDEAVATGENLGFLLGDGWAGVDFDDVMLPGTSTPADWVQRIMRQFDTYTEISPSGTGIKLFMHGTITGDPIAKRAGIEVYDRQRYFTVTGRSLSQVGIGECTESLQALYDMLVRGDVLELCRLRGLLLTTDKPDATGTGRLIDMHCPWAEEHSGAGNHTSTSLHVTDLKADGFKCFHAHCAERSIADVRKWLGLPAWDPGKFRDVEKNGKPSSNSQQNIRIALDELGVQLSFDEFLRRPQVSWPEATYRGAFEDAIRDRIWLTIDERFKFRPSPEFFNTVLLDHARRHGFHPVRQHLQGLRWDGTERLDTWLSTYTGAEDNAYTRAVGSLFLRAAVNRVFSPGCKFDEMLVLVSRKQGVLKSTTFRTLTPDPTWFTDSLPLGAEPKECIERTGGIWIAEVSDLHGLTTRALEQVKAFMSRQTDGPARMAYDRLPVAVPRAFVVGGTTNSLSFLRDENNRRFWPVRVRQVDIDALARDRDQLWAEAMHRRGDSIRLHPSLWKDAEKHQRAHALDDPWLATLQDALGLTDGAVPRDRIRLTEPFALLGIPADRQDAKQAERVETIMGALGYEKKQARGLHASDAVSTKRWCHTDEAVAEAARARRPRQSTMPF